MIARFLTASVLALGVTTLGYAQEAVPAPAEAAVTNAAATSPAAEPAVVPVRLTAAEALAAVGVDPKDYRLGPEDVIEVFVWKNAELSRPTVPIRPDGKITLPLVNDIVAAGYTTNQLKAMLTAEYGRFIDGPEITVGVKELHSFKVSVGGMVRMPGVYEVKSEATVLDLLFRAQGFADFANKNDITVLHRDGTREKFKYDDAVDGKDGANPRVRSGDIITVK
jgi:polysaccharide biosynthesis/export protein